MDRVVILKGEGADPSALRDIIAQHDPRHGRPAPFVTQVMDAAVILNGGGGRAVSTA